MSDPATGHIHRRCEKCQHVHRTRAKKAWRCPHCRKLNHIKIRPYESPPKVEKYRPTRLEP